MKVVEIFKSLQGEGIHIGAPTVFVRFAGCNLRCDWCDTKYAWEGGEEKTADAIIEEVRGHGVKRVCLTGGEPMLQKGIVALVNRMLNCGLDVTLETNGTCELEELPCTERFTMSMDVKCPSSGVSEKTNASNVELLGPTDQLKFIVADKSDYDYAKKYLKENPANCTIVMTPVGGLDLKWLAEAVLKDKLDARVLPQLHKMIWGDERRR